MIPAARRLINMNIKTNNPLVIFALLDIICFSMKKMNTGIIPFYGHLLHQILQVVLFTESTESCKQLLYLFEGPGSRCWI